MAETILERVLHYKCPEWGDSVRAARSAVGFRFDLADEQLWQWLVSGGHVSVKELAGREVQRLGTEEFYEYYLCCFYSDYELPGGTIDFEAIQGPPWFIFRCPAAISGSEWQESIESARAELYRKLGLKHLLGGDTPSGEFLSWFFYGGGSDEVAKLALKRVNELGMVEVNSVLWVCCFLPPGAKWMTSKSTLFTERFPQIMEWEQFGATCVDHQARRRVRAYPTHIDWTEGVSPPDGFVILPPKPGIHYKIESGQRMSLGIAWDPLVATSETDLCDAVRAVQRYYKYRYHKHNVEQASGTLANISMEKRKGGRPRWGAAEDALAQECVILKNVEGLTYKEIGEKFGLALQEDSYGNLSQCSKARRLVRRGRELIATEHNTS